MQICLKVLVSPWSWLYLVGSKPKFFLHDFYRLGVYVRTLDKPDWGLTGVGTGPGPCPGKFSIPRTESRNSFVPGTVTQSWVPESLVRQIWVPDPNHRFSNFASRSQSRVPDFSNFSPGPRSLKFRIWVTVPVLDLKMSPGPGSRFPGPKIWMPGFLMVGK